MTLHPDALALYLTCLESPEDDAPRFILADWFREFGQDWEADYIERRTKYCEPRIASTAHGTHFVKVILENGLWKRKWVVRHLPPSPFFQDSDGITDPVELFFREFPNIAQGNPSPIRTRVSRMPSY